VFPIIRHSKQHGLLLIVEGWGRGSLTGAPPFGRTVRISRNSIRECVADLPGEAVWWLTHEWFAAGNGVLTLPLGPVRRVRAGRRGGAKGA